MKSKVSPGFNLYQVVVQDFEHRHAPPSSVVQSGHIFKRYNDIEDVIPLRTLFRWAKDGKRAKASASKKGTVIACQKVDPSYRLNMIDHLRIEQKPIYVDITVEDFTVGRDLVVEGAKKSIEIQVNGLTAEH